MIQISESNNMFKGLIAVPESLREQVRKAYSPHAEGSNTGARFYFEPKQIIFDLLIH
jgi:hypothetical protein